MDALWTPQYYQEVLATNPITYWMLDEKAGAVAYDIVSGRVAGAKNGAYTGVTLGSPGIGDGRTSPYYDGANDYTNVYSAAFNGTFSGSTGTVSIWAKVSAVGVWTDGAQRQIVNIEVNASNTIQLAKRLLNNQLAWLYVAGATTKVVFKAGLTTIDWMNIAMTWDVNAGATGEMIAYYNGLKEGATQVGLGAWAGALSNTDTTIGASSTVPAEVWNGYLAHCAVWNRALPAANIYDLYRKAFI